MSAWEIVYNNDVGPRDNYFIEWWDVVNQTTGMSFRAEKESDAEFLRDILNEHLYATECM